MDDDAEKISNEISDADGIIIGSPTYESNISGQLKTFVDRGHLIFEQSLYRKYALGVITSENYGSSAAAAILKRIFMYSGAYISSMVKHKLPFSSSPDFENDVVKQFEQKAERLYQDIKNQRVFPYQKIFHKIILNIGIKPFVTKKGACYQGVINRWKTVFN